MKDNKAEGSLRELLKGDPDLKAAFKESAKAFSIPYEAWYAETSVKPFENEHIMIGFYYENDGTEGEFRLEWGKYGIALKAYNDAWEALSKMPELIELLGKIDRGERN